MSQRHTPAAPSHPGRPVTPSRLVTPGRLSHPDHAGAHLGVLPHLLGGVCGSGSGCGTANGCDEQHRTPTVPSPTDRAATPWPRRRAPTVPSLKIVGQMRAVSPGTDLRTRAELRRGVAGAPGRALVRYVLIARRPDGHGTLARARPGAAPVRHRPAGVRGHPAGRRPRPRPAHRTPARRRRRRDATLRPSRRPGVGWRPRRRPRRPARGRRRGPFPARHPRRRGGPRVRGRARPPARRLPPPPAAPPRRPAAHRRRRLHRRGQVDPGEQPGPGAGHPLRGAAPDHPLARAGLPSRRRGAGSPTPACCPS